MKTIITCLLSLWLTCSAWATWYGDKLRDGSDIFMVDLQYPYWPESTYFACWNINTFPNGGYFYGGVACGPPENANLETYRPGTVWSFWPDQNYGGRQVRNVYMNPVVYARQYVGEGASGSAGGRDVPWIKTGQWYTMMLRTWGKNEEKKECFVGWWMKDQVTNQWHHIGTFLVPAAATGFKGNGGFLEDFGNAGRKQRELWRGKGFSRYEGKWEKCDTVSVDVPKDDGIWFPGWHVNLIENDSVVKLTHSCNRELGANLEAGKKYDFTIKQPETPTFDPIEAQGTVRQSGKSLIVDWAFSENSSPQLGYKMEVFHNDKYEGTPSLVIEDLTPQVRTKSIELPDDKKAFVRLTLIDIFDQNKILPLTTEQKTPSVSTAPATDKLIPGLEYKYLEADMNAGTLDKVDFTKPLRSGISRGFDIALRGLREGQFAFSYEGFLRVPAAGAYTFVLKSCDGSRLSLGDKVIIDNDGLHSASEKRVSVFLPKGDLPLKLDFFKKDGSFEHTMAWLGWEYDNKPLSEIPLDNLLCKKAPGVPVVELKINNDGTEKRLTTILSEGTPDKIEYYNGTKLLATVDKAPFEARTMLFNGKNNLWARVFYNGSKTVDTPHLMENSQVELTDGWKDHTRGEIGLAHAVTNKNNTFHFVGEGEYIVNKPIKGDFTLTAKIDRLSSREMNTGDDCWAGLMARTLNDQDGYDREFAVFHTVGRDLRTSADFSDLGTGRMALIPSDKKNTWLRITRQGQTFTSWSSPDGKEWKLELERYVPQEDTIMAGLTFRTIPGTGKGIFSASVSDVTLLPTESKPAEPIRLPENKGKILGYSLLSPTMIAIRGQKEVTLLEKKNGKYEKLPFTMPQGVTFARSMAMTEGKLFLLGANAEGGALYRSSDMGKTWETASGEIAVNPDPRRALAGELISVDPFNPKRILAGSEGKGLFASQDGGQSWEKSGLENESFTQVIHNPLSADHIRTLSLDLKANTGKLHSSFDGAKSWSKVNEVPGVGFLKLVFDTRGPSETYLFSQRGLYTSFTQGATLSRSTRTLPSDQPILALDCRRKDLSTIIAVPMDGKGVYYTDQNALSWNKIADDQGWGTPYSLYIDKDNFNHVTVFAENGIFESQDEGKTWNKTFPVLK